MPRASSTSTTARAFPANPAAARGLEPYPGRSTATAWSGAGSRACTLRQSAAEPGCPCSRSSWCERTLQVNAWQALRKFRSRVDDQLVAALPQLGDRDHAEQLHGAAQLLDQQVDGALDAQLAGGGEA